MKIDISVISFIYKNITFQESTMSDGPRAILAFSVHTNRQILGTPAMKPVTNGDILDSVKGIFPLSWFKNQHQPRGNSPPYAPRDNNDTKCPFDIYLMPW